MGPARDASGPSSIRRSRLQLNPRPAALCAKRTRAHPLGFRRRESLSRLTPSRRLGLSPARLPSEPPPPSLRVLPSVINTSKDSGSAANPASDEARSLLRRHQTLEIRAFDHACRQLAFAASFKFVTGNRLSLIRPIKTSHILSVYVCVREKIRLSIRQTKFNRYTGTAGFNPCNFVYFGNGFNAFDDDTRRIHQNAFTK